MHFFFMNTGICIDMIDGAVANHNVDLSIQPDNSPGLCTNNLNDNCCSCFKSIPQVDSPFYRKPCSAKELDGVCIGRILGVILLLKRNN